MISVKEVIEIHSVLIEKFGGSGGIRDLKLLESAVLRPYQTFNKKELYPGAIEKAAALIESIINNHPFIDGNKRLGYVLMRLILLEYEKDIDADENEKYQFVLNIANGELRFDGICNWIIKNIKK